VDVGINVVDDRVVGDADPEIYEIVKAYTPVPGGVGSLTTALLFRNLLHCATLQGVI
jgi:methylenetetrahydrofolate dehydrogenase (NADP+)/methenyltetrahydrofolate cyclohydrolase